MSYCIQRRLPVQSVVEKIERCLRLRRVHHQDYQVIDILSVRPIKGHIFTDLKKTLSLSCKEYANAFVVKLKKKNENLQFFRV